MKPTVTASAGSASAGDILITAAPCVCGTHFTLKGRSAVMKLFRRREESLIRQTLAEHRVENADITAEDNGALDCTIRARLICALQRTLDQTSADDRAQIEAEETDIGARGIVIDANDPKKLMDARLYGITPVWLDLTVSDQPDAARLLLKEAVPFFGYSGDMDMYIVIHNGPEGARDVAMLKELGLPFVKRKEDR